MSEVEKGPQLERGTPSPQLQQAIRDNQAESEAAEYEHITDAAPEQGMFHIVGGYLDDDGKVHSEVHLRSLSGEEEDLLGNRKIPMLDRLQTILKNCTQRLGDITDRSAISQAVDRLPSGSRQHLMICLRRTTHWLRTKDIFDMEVRCPYQDCRHKGSYQVDLSEIETYEMPNPDKREFTVTLSDGTTVVWRVGAFAQEKMIDAITDKDETASMTYVILTRLVSINGEDARLSTSDFLTPDHKKMKLSPKARQLMSWVKKLPSADREELRISFLDEEPGVETTLTIECPKCNEEFEGRLDASQGGFWFPSVTSKRSKMRSST